MDSSGFRLNPCIAEFTTLRQEGDASKPAEFTTVILYGSRWVIRRRRRWNPLLRIR